MHNNQQLVNAVLLSFIDTIPLHDFLATMLFMNTVLVNVNLEDHLSPEDRDLVAFVSRTSAKYMLQLNQVITPEFIKHNKQ